jgi:cell division protein FtsB
MPKSKYQILYEREVRRVKKLTKKVEALEKNVAELNSEIHRLNHDESRSTVQMRLVGQVIAGIRVNRVGI